MTKDADTPGYPAVLVTQSVKPSLIASYLVDVDQNTGHFTVKGLPTGSYDVDFVDAGGDTFPEYWQSSPTRAGATAVVVTAGAATTIAPVLHVGARVTGTIRYESSTGSQMPTSAGVSQYSRAADGSLTQAPNTWVWAYGDGGWISEWVLPPGSYSWGFSPAPINGDYDFPPQYFGGRTAAAAADVPAPLGMSSVPMVLQPATFTSSRISGASRYETAATIADAVISVGTHPDVVYLASGENFPDSLSAGAAAAHDRTVVLTTTRDALPASIAAELDRLQPHEIRIVGGTAAISDDVTEQIQTKVPTASVTRIAGADRYETSRLVAQTAFSTGATTAFVATGRNYPDALAAGGAAAKVGGPVLLVDGDASTADSPTIALLTDLGVKTVDIAGGTAAVTSGLEASLDTHFAIGRLAGADRYATAAEINRGAFYDRIAPSTLPPRSVVVTGTVFADAVVAAPLAAVLGAPIELSMPGCIPEASMSSIVQLGATDMTLLGGTTALGADVAAAHACSGPYSTGSLDLTQLPH
jgi:putative cell wall-binding protein